VIFATVGTHHEGFPRMLAALSSLGDGEALDVQFGNGVVPPNASAARDYYSFGEMAERFAAARIVVTHAGVGSILLAIRAGHVPIVLPRLKRFGEHVDDHQVALARALEADGHVVVCWETEQLPALVASAKDRSVVAKAAPTDRPIALAVARALRGDSVGEHDVAVP